MVKKQAGAAAAGATEPTSNWLASNIGINLSPSLLDSVWATRLLFILQTFAAPLALWFKPLCVLIALFWLAYRASQVLNRPLDDLSSLLGFDLPSNPLVDLASIKSDGAIIHWTSPEKPKQKSQCKYEIYLNGHVIDSLSPHESAITLTGLQPDSFYVVRVALIQNEFSSKSTAIRFRTKPATSGDFFFVAADGLETDNDALHEFMPRVRPYRALKDITPASPTSAPMAREGSSGLGTRRASGRRPSPAAFAMDNKHDPQPDDSEPPEGAETIQQLTEKLDGIRTEADEAERQARDDDEEETRQKEDFVKERDELRAQTAEKEKHSKALRRDVSSMERQNYAAQNERSKQERLLHQKKQEREKLQKDIVRWEHEALEMVAETERIHKAKAAYADKAANEKDALRRQLADENTKVHDLDNEVKEKGLEMKKLERTLKTSVSNGTEQPEPNLVQLFQTDAEEERSWQLRRQTLQHQYGMSCSKLESAKRFHDEQMRYLETIRAERRHQDEMAQYVASPQQPERLPRRGDSQRSRHAPSRHSISQSPRLANFPPGQSPFASNINPAPPVFNSAPFLNIQNGMTISGPTDHISMSEEEKERLTGGALMSPGAGADLLPADLFAGDGDNRASAEHVQPLPGLGSLPGLPGPPQPFQSLDPMGGPGPASPGSASSRSASLFASPHASQHNLHGLGGSESLIDVDRRSIRSTRSTRAASGSTGSRFGGMFGIKQRNKIGLDDGPPLAKSSSMPRQDQFIPGLDATTRKRNSSISGSGFAGVVDGTLDGSADRPAATGKSRLNIFNRERSGGWPTSFNLGRRPQSPRPDSTHSNELPRPSMDSNRWGIDGWQPGENTNGARGSPLAFGPGWNAPPPQQSRLYGSRHPSRRPSVQYTASGPPEDILEDDDSDALDPGEGQQFAPIGTKPPPGSKKADGGAKLNPNARNFKSLFSFKSTDKSKENESSGENKGESSSTPVASSTPNLGAMDIDDSPPQSRKSRDAPSTTTAESSTLESGRNSAELVRTPSYSTSDAPAPSPSLAGSAKETFMQKITRKSSSGKFGLSTFRSSAQRDKSRLDPTSASNSSAATPVPAEDDEDEMSASASSLRESKESSRGSRSWSSAFKLGKKKGAEVERESLSGMSGDEEEEA